MYTLTWIVGGALAMSAIAWVGLALAALREEHLEIVRCAHVAA